MDGFMKALMALDEIPRTEPDWRTHSNRPPRYTPPPAIAPQKLW